MLKGAGEGSTVSDIDGVIESVDVGASEGWIEGAEEGSLVGETDGVVEGIGVGNLLGGFVGYRVG